VKATAGTVTRRLESGRSVISDLTLRPVTEDDVRDFATRRYEPPSDDYNMTQPVDEAVQYFLQPETNCHVILREDELAGFCTFGSDAWVPAATTRRPVSTSVSG